MSYQIDETGLLLIRSFEGYRNGAYADSEGYATCGVGHLLHRSPPTAQDHRTYDGKGWDFYSHLLLADVERVAMAPMRAKIRVPLNQNRVNALASLAFNCGGGVFDGTVGRLLNARDFAGAANAFMLWSHPTVLAPRRRQEAALFQRPAKNKSATRLPWLTDKERRMVLEYDRLKSADRNLERRRELRREMHHEAVAIRWAAHHHGGWESNHRRQRYHSLLARAT